jgi:hypothetical protein
MALERATFWADRRGKSDLKREVIYAESRGAYSATVKHGDPAEADDSE